MYKIIILTILFIKVREYECSSDLLACKTNQMDYYCESANLQATLHTWTQRNGNSLLASIEIQAKKTRYFLQLEKFDNSTIVTLNTPRITTQQLAKQSTIHLQAGQYVDNSHVPLINYTETMMIRYDCSPHLRFAKYSWVGIIDPSGDGIKTYRKNTLNSQYSKTETNSILCCLVYEIEAQGDVRTIIRKVIQKTRLVYEEHPKTNTFEPLIDSTRILSSSTTLRPVTNTIPKRACTDEEVTKNCECKNNNDCRSNQACVDNTCKNPCDGACGEGANCYPFQHQASCRCPPDKILANKNCVQCISDSNCRIDQACVGNTCKDPCVVNDCGQGAKCDVIQHRAQCYCPTNTVLDSYQNCVQCINDSNCRIDQACIGNICKDPCVGKVCGQGAKCDVIQHRAQCSSPNPVTVNYHVGQTFSMVCLTTVAENISIKWEKICDTNSSLITIPSAITTKLNFSFIVESFDDNSVYTCKAPNKELMKYQIRVLDKNSDNHNVARVRYSESDEVEFNCQRTPHDVHLALISPTANIITVLEKTGQIMNKKSDNGTILCCLFYVKQNNGVVEIIRIVENKTMFIYQESAAVSAGADKSEGEIDVHNTLIIVLSVIGIIVLLLIIAVVIKKYCQKKPVQNLEQEEELQTYVSSDKIIYAELDVQAPNNHRHNTKIYEHSPYAQIVGVMKPEEKQ